MEVKMTRRKILLMTAGATALGRRLGRLRRPFAASNVSVGVSPISIVKMLCRTFAVILPFTISPSSNTRRKALERADDALLSVYFSKEAHQNVSFAFCFALAARLPFFVAFPHVV